MHLSAWLCLLAILIGNCGFWLFCFNRINATGMNRHATKVIEKTFIFACFVIPAVILWWEAAEIWTWLVDPQANWWPIEAICLSVYGAFCLLSLLFLGGMWLESRFWLIPPSQLLTVTSEVHHVDGRIHGGSAADNSTRFLSRLPGSDIGYLEVTRKRLQLGRPIKGIEGLSIGHISDLHFTGQYKQEHYEYILQRFMDLSPEMIVISGDIIDYDRCLSWIEPLLALHAPLGCYFVLGNHDLRVKDFPRLLKSLEKVGHVDLGRGPAQVTLPTGADVNLVGNESPWLQRRAAAHEGFSELASQATDSLRLAVSHSPDQIDWARRHRADLLLAGHTHGGQVRFPVIGPVVSPSNYGSKFASGVFYLEPTLMHVSRGIAGTHPIRWRCKPEISLLTLVTMDSTVAVNRLESPSDDDG